MRLSTLTSISENLSNASIRFGNSLDKLSSGIKVNKASDDGSGLAISDKLRTQVTSIRSAIDNGNSAIAMLQIADKSMAEQSKILDSIKAKLIQASTDTTSVDGRIAIQKDINKLLAQLDNIASQTNYNGQQLISSSNALSASNIHIFQLGEKSSDSITTTAIQANTSGLPQNAAEKSTQSTNINTTISGMTPISVSSNDDNFSLTLTGAAAQSAFSYDSGAYIDGLSKGTITFNDGGRMSTNYMIMQDNASGTDFTSWLSSQAGVTSTGSNGFDIAVGTTIDLSNYNTRSSFSNFLILVENEGDSISLSDMDITRLVNGGVEPLNVVGTKDAQVSASGIKTLADLKDLNTLLLDDAKTYQQVVDDSIEKLNDYRSDIGSTQNQIESAVRNLVTQATNIEAAKSTILDVDYASESANFNKEMIILNAGQFSLTQANTYQSSILSLLQQ